MCSAGGSGDADDVTTCRLVCPRGLTLPRPADSQLTTADTFQCRRDVGVWTPTDRVPSCVGQSTCRPTGVIVGDTLWDWVQDRSSILTAAESSPKTVQIILKS